MLLVFYNTLTQVDRQQYIYAVNAKKLRQRWELT